MPPDLDPLPPFMRIASRIPHATGCNHHCGSRVVGCVDGSTDCLGTLEVPGCRYRERGRWVCGGCRSNA